MSLTNRIKELADQKKVTFAEIERIVGISNGQIRRWDTSSPKIENIQKVADFFDVSTDYLLGRSTTTSIEGNVQEESLSSQIMFRMNTEGLSEDEVDELKDEVDRFLRFRRSEIERERERKQDDKA
ncbi:hypothetical protein HW555_014136 [Spodoptera exigua]|uniref:HTH cro/C1-type domain-containing protein n=1 Tax=Spodoptera exigua TaxID=7107 RepID=A0A835G1Y4_SPOEX|nr:hypothetical protein HW555_014136 [Spodoptera exigua]